MSSSLQPTTANAVYSFVGGCVFLVVALLVGALAYGAVSRELRRLDGAVRLPGTVLGLVNPCETKPTLKTSNCWPHVNVRYTDVDGRQRQFLNSAGWQRPNDAPGDLVTVIHPAGDPKHPLVYSPWVEWFVPAIASLLASLFTLTALYAIVRNALLWRDRVWLGRWGVRVEAGDIRLTRIAHLGGTGGNSYRPFVVVATWRDPRDAGPVTFRSDPLYYDPTALLAGRPSIGVCIDPDRPSRYWMEIAPKEPPGGTGRAASVSGVG